MAIARGGLASYFANEAITRFANDPIDIGREREREGHWYQRLPRETTLRGPGPNGAIGEAALHEWAALFMEGREEHKCKHKNPLGASILCGLTTARKDIDAAHRGPWG